MEDFVTDYDSLGWLQLNIEREAGRTFTGFSEGKIFFAPTYKYSHNSDNYAGETVKSKKKRRTPAWYFHFHFKILECYLRCVASILSYRQSWIRLICRCDRILWRGNGIEQLSYIRGESRFSDHRPVCAVFSVEVEKDVMNKISINRLRKGFSCANPKFEYEDCIPQRHSFYEYWLKSLEVVHVIKITKEAFTFDPVYYSSMIVASGLWNI